MSLLYNCFNNFVKTNYNYTDLLKYIKKKLTSGLLYSSNLDYINSLFLQSKYRNNKYFYPYEYISELTGYNQYFIRNSNTANINEIEQLIADNDTLLGIRFKYTHIPDDPHNLLIDQIYEISQQDTLFDFKNLNTSFYEKNFRNFFNHILFNQQIDNKFGSFFVKYYFHVILTKIFANNNIQSKLNNIILLNPTYSEELKYQTLINDFNNYIDNTNNRKKISDSITKIVLKSTYDFTSISDKFKTKLSSYINRELIDKIKDHFEEFNHDYEFEVAFQYNKYISQLTTAKTSQLATDDVYNKRLNFLEDNYTSLFNINKQNYEDMPIHIYSRDINSINIEKYLYCQQCHKNNSYKYLNITNDIISQYINNEVKQESNNSINILNFRSLIRSKEPYINTLINHKYIFTQNSKYIKCQSLDGFNAINIEDTIFPTHTTSNYSRKVVNKDISDLTIELNLEYIGPSTISVPRGQQGLPIFKFKRSDAIDNNLKANNLIEYLKSTIFNTEVCDTIEKENIIKLAGLLSLHPYIERFIKSDFFDKFIDNLLHDIYKELRLNGFTTYDYNWIIHKKLLTIYFNFLLKAEYVDDKLFNTINITYYDIIMDDLRTEPVNFFDFNESKLDIIRDSIFNVEYRNMHQFYENMITSSLTANLIQKMIKYYV